MKPLYHLIVSLILFIILFLITGNPWSAVVLVSGVLIDLDHLLDFWLFLGFKRWYKISGEYYKEIGKALLVAHSLEIIFILALFYFLTRWSVLAMFIIGYCVHILMDMVHNYRRGMNPLNFWFVYRASQGFDLKRIAPFFYEN